jgi:hypothetical protein
MDHFIEIIPIEQRMLGSEQYSSLILNNNATGQGIRIIII